MTLVSSRTAVILLKLSFWLGAITDGLAVLPMLFPGIGIALFGGDSIRLGPEYRYAMGFGTSLMAGWTILLLWGAKKPLERRGILLITLFPVITGIVATSIFGVVERLVTLSGMIPLWIHLGILSSLFLFSYVAGGKVESVIGEKSV
jgi:hypothetical protein